MLAAPVDIATLEQFNEWLQVVPQRDCRKDEIGSDACCDSEQICLYRKYDRAEPGAGETISRILWKGAAEQFYSRFRAAGDNKQIVWRIRPEVDDTDDEVYFDADGKPVDMATFRGDISDLTMRKINRCASIYFRFWFEDRP